MSNLRDEATAARQLIDSLQAMGEDDEDIIATAIEGETGLTEAVTAALEKAEMDEAFCTGIDARISDLKARKERLKHRIGRTRESIADAMLFVGVKKLTLPTATLSVSDAPPSVVVIDEGEIPAEYWREVTERKLDKTALSKALKAGANINGATLENLRSRLTIRTK